MLQSRPVTNLDNSFTEYEIMHEMDTPHPTEHEIYSRAHWGENFPGSSSWTVFTWSWGNKSMFFVSLFSNQSITVTNILFEKQRFGLQQGSVTEDDYNPYTNGMGIQYNQLMFNMTNVCLIFKSIFLN